MLFTFGILAASFPTWWWWLGGWGLEDGDGSGYCKEGGGGGGAWLVSLGIWIPFLDNVGLWLECFGTSFLESHVLVLDTT